MRSFGLPIAALAAALHGCGDGSVGLPDVTEPVDDFDSAHLDLGLVSDTTGESSLGPQTLEAVLGAGEVGALSDEDPVAEATAACSISLSSSRSLMIRHLSVVEDPIRTRWTGGVTSAADGAWHFGRLMANMAGDLDPAVFVRGWLAQWESAQTVNGVTVPARTAIRNIIRDWPKLANGKLDLTKAPMRLLAIVNRFDLRKLSQGNAGEGRFVFGVVDKSGAPLSFAIILEYKLLASSESQALRWARDWQALSELSGAQYNAKLQSITNRFAGKGVAPSLINGSAISQVRTNEVAIGPSWELREFRLSSTGRLKQSVTAMTPRDALKGTARLGRFVNANLSAIKEGRHTVPLVFEDAPFAGAATVTDFVPWNASAITDQAARHVFSLSTCSGCHGVETDTGFLHVGVRAAGRIAPLSGFLTGVDVIDPVSGTKRRFADLAGRARGLRAYLCEHQ